jgi:hypothetical protein
MKLNRFMLVNAILAFIFGFLYLCFPEQGLAILGLSTDLTGLYMTRFFGSALTAIGFVCLFERQPEPAALKGLITALLIGNILGLIVSIFAQLTGAPNMLCWGILLIYLLLASGYAYFRFFARYTANKPD